MTEVAQAPGRFRTVAAMAAALGIEVPALEGLFLTHAHRDAAAWLQAARVKAAGALLLSGSAGTVGEVCGFPSLEAFAAGFQRATGLTPAGYQALGLSAAFTLALPPDYRVEDMLAYHGRDPLSLSERVAGAALAKGVAAQETAPGAFRAPAPGPVSFGGAGSSRGGRSGAPSLGPQRFRFMGDGWRWSLVNGEDGQSSMEIDINGVRAQVAASSRGIQSVLLVTREGNVKSYHPSRDAAAEWLTEFNQAVQFRVEDFAALAVRFRCFPQVLLDLLRG